MSLVPLLFLTASLTAQQENPESRNQQTENDFVIQAASGGIKEVELGKIAREKGQSPEVKDFGDRMVRDHSKANEELKAFTLEDNIILPDTMMEMDRMHVDELSELSGKEFDRAYIEMMIEDHEKTIELFEDASENHDDPEIKSWAQKTLPALKEHLKIAEQLQEKVKSEGEYKEN